MSTTTRENSILFKLWKEFKGVVIGMWIIKYRRYEWKKKKVIIQPGA